MYYQVINKMKTIVLAALMASVTFAVSDRRFLSQVAQDAGNATDCDLGATAPPLEAIDVSEPSLDWCPC